MIKSSPGLQKSLSFGCRNKLTDVHITSMEVLLKAMNSVIKTGSCPPTNRKILIENPHYPPWGTKVEGVHKVKMRKLTIREAKLLKIWAKVISTVGSPWSCHVEESLSTSFPSWNTKNQVTGLLKQKLILWECFFLNLRRPCGLMTNSGIHPSFCRKGTQKHSQLRTYQVVLQP